MDAYLLALLFHPSAPSARKITHFCQRFDPRFPRFGQLIMTLLPPFSLLSTQAREVLPKLEEEVESYLFGHQPPQYLQFDQVDIFNGGKKILYLKPHIPSDISYIQEGVDEFLLEQSVSYRDPKASVGHRRLSFLPIGRFYNLEELQEALAVVEREGLLPTQLPIQSIGLFRKSQRQWNLIHELITFEQEREWAGQKKVMGL